MDLIGIIVGVTAVFIAGVVTNELGHRLDHHEKRSKK